MTIYYQDDGVTPAFSGGPYTEEEELEFYRRVAGIKPDGTWAGGFKMLHATPRDQARGAPASQPSPQKTEPPQSPEE